jgi:hypothetical protein
MSATVRKDRVVIGICRAPPNLSKEEFLSRFVDSVIAVPIARKNYLKFQLTPQFIAL